MGVASEQPDLVFSVDQVLHQDVVEPGPDGFPAVLGESQGLWHCLWVYLGLPSGCQIYLTHQRNWESLTGPGDRHHELQDLQVRPGRSQQDSGGTSIQAMPE